MYSIAMILPYFLGENGKWPSYFSLFLESCRKNSTVDFYLFTDDAKLQDNCSGNIKCICMSLLEMQTLLEKQLRVGNLPYKLIPYKLCDYKPVYGNIFLDWIKDYDFWGHLDCDTILGDIRSFFSDDFLDKYDNYLVAGHFQIKRNTEEVRSYYLLPRDGRSPHQSLCWGNVILEKECLGFDEFNGYPLLLWENDKRCYCNVEIYADIWIPQEYSKMLDIEVMHNSAWQYWKWTDGKLYHVNARNGKEIPLLYIHMQKRLMKMWEVESNAKEVYILPDSVITTDASCVRKRNRKQFVLGAWAKEIARKIIPWIRWHLQREHEFAG